jgi:hypothetical protein
MKCAISNRSEAFVVSVLIGLAATTGCGDPTAAMSKPVTVTVASDTVVALETVYGEVTLLRFTIPVAIHNGWTVPVSIDFCASSVDEPSGTKWRTVWAPVCAAEGSNPWIVEPGATGTFPWQVAAAVRGPAGPAWNSATVSGPHRFNLSIAAVGRRTSNTFAVSLVTTSASSTVDLQSAP